MFSLSPYPFAHGRGVGHSASLQIVGPANSGGQGKALVADGEERVDGRILEQRKTAKIRSDHVVVSRGASIAVLAP